MKRSKYKKAKGGANVDKTAEHLNTDSLDHSQNQIKKVDAEHEAQPSHLLDHIDQSLREYESLSKEKIDMEVKIN